MIERGGQVVLRVLENVQQATIKPIMEKFIKSGSLVNTDEYDIYGRLAEWGYEHKTVCHKSWRVCEGRGWGRRSRGSCEHDGGILVVVT